MNADMHDRFIAFIGEYLEERKLLPSDFVKIVDINEWDGMGGYCSTCEYITTFLDIYYLDAQGSRQKLTIETSIKDIFGV